MFTNDNRIWNVAIESYKREQDWEEIVALDADATLKAAKVLLQFLFEYIWLKITYKFNFVFKYLHSCHTVADKKLSMHFLAKWCLLLGIATVTNILKLKMTEGESV